MDLAARGRAGALRAEADARDDSHDLAALVAADLVSVKADGRAEISAAGRAYLARQQAARAGVVDPFLAQHVAPVEGIAERPEGRATVRIDASESPLVWLARRKGRDGQPLVTGLQLQAGERLRAEFTRAQLTPRMTSNWSAATQSLRSAGAVSGNLAEVVVAARQRLRHALDAVGPEFAGLLLDVCCFLKRLDDVERERQWPARSAKVVLQLGLDRLARHYGLSATARGRAYAPTRSWLAPDAQFSVDAV
jgi:hypothetical protein